jgi:hypothetical protein
MNRVNSSSDSARLVPNEPFPAYAFIPGRSPHPTSDPAGHSFGKEPSLPPPLDSERWYESRPYLFGIDLFNAGYYWESHVAWESLWLACGRKGLVADFLKALIHLAAAGVKAQEGKPQGVKSHGSRAREGWQKLMRSLPARQGAFMGFALAELIALADAIDQTGWPEAAPVLLPAFPEQ